MPNIAESLPLSGKELKDIICQRLREKLDKDCTLFDDLSYPGFHLKFTMHLDYLFTTPASSTMVWMDEKHDVPAEGAENGSADVADEAKYTSPNLAREEHDMDIPVIVQTPGGPELRKVRGRPRKTEQ